MKNGTIVIMILAACGVSILPVPPAVAQDNLCGPFEACVKITYPSDKGPASVEPEPLKVTKDVRENAGMMAFVIVAENGKDTRIEFECQSASGTSDCRTPAVANGNPQWLVKVKANGMPHPVRIGHPLDKCDEYDANNKEVDLNKWKEENCTYKYSVQDEDGVHELLDPNMIMEPK